MITLDQIMGTSERAGFEQRDKKAGFEQRDMKAIIDQHDMKAADKQQPVSEQHNEKAVTGQHLDKAIRRPSFMERHDETIANMGETDWMTMMMEMRIISA